MLGRFPETWLLGFTACGFGESQLLTWQTCPNRRRRLNHASSQQRPPRHPSSPHSLAAGWGEVRKGSKSVSGKLEATTIVSCAAGGAQPIALLVVVQRLHALDLLCATSTNLCYHQRFIIWLLLLSCIRCVLCWCVSRSKALSKEVEPVTVESVRALKATKPVVCWRCIIISCVELYSW